MMLLRLPVYSPSQMSTYRDCARKWAYEKLWRQRKREKPSQALGKAVHRQLELWFKHGTPINRTTQAGEIAGASLHLWPAPGPDLRTEEHFIVRIGRHVYQGYIDLGCEYEDAPPLIGDHKTTSNLGYALSEETLPVDPQGVIYSAARFIGLPDPSGRPREAGCDVVDLQWVYTRTTKHYRALPVRAQTTPASIRPALEVLDAQAESMSEVYFRRPRHPHDVAPNAAACGKYGGCDFRPLCTDITAADEWYSLMAQSMDQQMAAWLAQSKNETAQQAAAGAPVPQPLVGGPQGYPPQGMAGPGGYANPPEANLLAQQAAIGMQQQMQQPPPQMQPNAFGAQPLQQQFTPPVQPQPGSPQLNPATGKWEVNGVPLPGQEHVQPVGQPAPQQLPVPQPQLQQQSPQMAAVMQFPQGMPQQFAPPGVQVLTAPAPTQAPQGAVTAPQPTAAPTAPKAKRVRRTKVQIAADAAAAASGQPVSADPERDALALKIGRMYLDMQDLLNEED